MSWKCGCGSGGGIERRDFLRWAAFGGAAVAAGAAREPAAAAGAAGAFELEEATIADLGAAMGEGRLSAEALAEAYLRRIETLDRRGPRVNSVIEINPDALAQARALDLERRQGRVRGALHGIPILLKDNLDTADRMLSTAGSLALADAPSPREAFVVSRLRAAGAVLLGKANLSEWANFRSTHSTSGWSARGGLTRNPYVLDRNPCGSSSGSAAAVAANLAAAAVGTETDGSIVCPATANGVVGVKPTVGLAGRSGITPISHTQDTPGPLARSVRDAAILLGALAGEDPADPATAAGRGRVHADYTRFLDPAGLAGARLGVGRNYFGFHDGVDRLMEEAIAALKAAGAEIVDPAEVPNTDKYGDAEYEVLLYEFKADLAAYLAARSAPVRTLAELVEFNERHRDREMAFFGQEIFLAAEKKGPLTDAAYLEALATCRKYSREEGLDAVLAKHRLDAVVAPTGGPAWTTDLLNGDHYTGGSSSAAAVAGYPSVSVPAGFLGGLPVGISFIGAAWSEPVLLRLAFAYEQATRHRRAPRFLPTAELGV